MQGEIGRLCDLPHTQIAHTFVRCSRSREKEPKENERQSFLVEPRVEHTASVLPTLTPSTQTGLTYLPRIHIYRDTYLSSL
jgi:hypothetical protein